MHVNKWSVFTLVGIGIFMSTLDSSIVNITFPVIMADLNVPLSTIEWVVMIYLLTVSSLLLPFGRLSDIKGRRWIFCRGFIIFVAGSLFCAIAPNAILLIISNKKYTERLNIKFDESVNNAVNDAIRKYGERQRLLCYRTFSPCR